MHVAAWCMWLVVKRHTRARQATVAGRVLCLVRHVCRGILREAARAAAGCAPRMCLRR